ncbi:6-phosphogluconolactonase [Persicitalea jodogahamensis]|uniref:Glucosamine-6-phosphate deaminase n=1 Tax=Persicitalea jodogahamensis TaxID=402147 RepID=A0A8J3D4K0_9BACT|nr:glucosamine-6-phosphate deaminase [Persicitalea jodogahamensis]GHB72195.1 glucosamine-6-phosphate deaminase [Persicitalea jodogahamensis]
MLLIHKNHETLSQAVAERVAKVVQDKPDAVICLPSGNTPLRLFEILVNQHEIGEIDFSRCTFVLLDEWLDMDGQDEGSCRYWIDKELLNPLGFQPEQIIAFDAKSGDLPGECERVNQKIKELGGFDLVVLGVGMNGHLALNEPGTPFDCYAHVSALDPMTAEVGQKYFTKQTPLTEGITLGLRHFLEARELIVMASGEAKAPVMKRALEGEVSEDFPASLVQKDEKILVMLDEAAAGN